MVPLFEYIGILFTSEPKWKELNNSDKTRNFFMMNRFMSINFPVQANVLSHYKIDAVSVSDYWHRSMRMKFKGVPKWIYAKTKKKEKEAKEIVLSDEFLKWHCNKEEISIAEHEQKKKFFGESYIKELLQLEKILKSQGVI